MMLLTQALLSHAGSHIPQPSIYIIYNNECVYIGKYVATNTPLVCNYNGLKVLQYMIISIVAFIL